MKPRACSGFFTYNEFMKNYLVHNLIKFLFLFFISITIHASGNESDSLLMESLDEVLIEEYKPCSDQSDISSFEVSTISSLMIVSEGSFFTEGEVITSASGVQAIVDSYDVETQKLTYHQDANTGFETFLLNETITGSSSGIAIVKEFIFDLTIPCSELIVSIEEEPQQMIFTPKESAKEAQAAAEAAAAEMMAEIEEELARQVALEAFQQKIADEKGMKFDYLVDEKQDVAKKYGAICTPDPFLFDQNRKLVFHGRIDNAMNPDDTATESTMQKNIEKYLAGEKIEKDFDPSIGCSIKWKLQQT